MARRKKIQLPAKVDGDIKKAANMLEDFTNQAEKVLADVISWGKKHKMLVAVVLIAIAIKRYYLDDEEEGGDY